MAAPPIETAAKLASKVDRPAAIVQTESFRQSRPQIVGPEIPESPYPIHLCGPVQHGFGRGGKDLGCPTANLPDESIEPISSVCKPGVYYGYAQVLPTDAQNGLSEEDVKVYPMAMSLGWNPFYKNERLTAEIHIIHEFKTDFYGLEMRAIVLGYIRPELDYTSRDIEALIADIDTDKRVALNSLLRPAYKSFECDPHFAVSKE